MTPEKQTYHVWREGNRLVVEFGATLPPRCVVCNRPTPHSTTLRLIWESSDVTPEAMIVSILTAPLGVVVISGDQRFAKVKVGICAPHRRLLWLALISAGVVYATSLALFILAVSNKALQWTVFPALFLIPLGFWLQTKRHPLKAQSIGRGQIRITGAGKQFLDALPGGSPSDPTSFVDDSADRLAKM